MALTPAGGSVDETNQEAQGFESTESPGGDTLAPLASTLMDNPRESLGILRGLNDQKAFQVAGVMNNFPNFSDFAPGLVQQVRGGDVFKEDYGHTTPGDEMADNGYIDETGALSQTGRDQLQQFSDTFGEKLSSKDQELLRKTLESGNISDLSPSERRELNKIFGNIRALSNMTEDEMERAARDESGAENEEWRNLINFARTQRIENKVNAVMDGIKNGDFNQLSSLMKQIADDPNSSFSKDLMSSLTDAMSNYAKDDVIMGFKNGNFQMSLQNENGTWSTMVLGKDGVPKYSTTTRQFEGSPADVPIRGAEPPTADQFFERLKRKFNPAA